MSNNGDFAATMYESDLIVAALNKVPGFDPLKLMSRRRTPGAEKEERYLDFRYKKLWFRLAHRTGRIRLNRLSITEQLAIIEAQVYLELTDSNPVSSFTAACTREESGDKYIEDAQIKAMDQALTDAGFGLQFVPAPAGSTENTAPQAAGSVANVQVSGTVPETVQQAAVRQNTVTPQQLTVQQKIVAQAAVQQTAVAAQATIQQKAVTVQAAVQQNITAPRQAIAQQRTVSPQQTAAQQRPVAQQPMVQQKTVAQTAVQQRPTAQQQVTAQQRPATPQPAVQRQAATPQQKPMTQQQRPVTAQQQSAATQQRPAAVQQQTVVQQAAVSARSVQITQAQTAQGGQKAVARPAQAQAGMQKAAVNPAASAASQKPTTTASVQQPAVQLPVSAETLPADQLPVTAGQSLPVAPDVAAAMSMLSGKGEADTLPVAPEGAKVVEKTETMAEELPGGTMAVTAATPAVQDTAASAETVAIAPAAPAPAVSTDQAAKEARHYTETTPVDQILQFMTLEDAKKVIVPSGTCRGWTLDEVAQRRRPSLRFYLSEGYQGKDNILRAAARLVLDDLEKKAG